MSTVKSGWIIYLTGVSGSGKTTLGLALKDQLDQRQTRPCILIDGDSVRNFFEHEFGYSSDERSIVTKQMAYAAKLVSEQGCDVIVANIAGTYSIRDFLRRKLHNYIQVFLDVDINKCIANDTKGIYKSHLGKEHPLLVGIDLPYEKPRNPDVVVQPYQESVEESVQKILNHLDKR